MYLKYSFLFLALHVFLLFSSQETFVNAYLKNVSPTYAVILLESETNMCFKIAYGKNLNALAFTQNFTLANSSRNSYVYDAIITNLTPKTKYFYCVSKGKINYFSTPALGSGNFRFVAMGDSRSQPKIFSEIMKDVNKINPDVIISMGDLVEDGGKKVQWKKYFFDASRNVISHIPFISTLGDHEGERDSGKLFAHYLFPRKNHKKLWYSFDVGNAHFVSLDYRYPKNVEMINWFENDMTNSDAKWNFVFTHRPCYNFGGHCSVWGRDTWPALFQKHKIDIVFSGHSHIYERFLPVKINSSSDWSVTYITTGGAGANLYKARTNQFLAKAFADYHYILFDIKNDSLLMTTFSTNNCIIDRMRIDKSAGYDKKYFYKSTSQKKLNFITMFLRKLSESINTIPLMTIPSEKKICIDSEFKKVGIKISLSKNSRKFYKMKSVKFNLCKGKTKQINLKIFAKDNITVSPWGLITPPLKLDGQICFDEERFEIETGNIEYWP